MPPRFVNQLLKPFLQYYALSWLKKQDYQKRADEKANKHLKRLRNKGIGRALGIEASTKIQELPLTSYEFYKPFFENPNPGDFMYPLEEYVRVYTSGTMGKPKTFLLPKKGLWRNIQATGMTMLFLSTHNGERIEYEVGDVIYQNTPGGQFLASFYYDLYEKKDPGWNVQVPDSNLSFQEKVDYFVEHYEEIDTAYMMVTTFLDQIYPRINKPIYLKGFMTQDRSAYVLKDKIKELTGNYPKTLYGSTETMFISLPSIEYPGCFFFDWRVVYPEFIPEKDAIGEPPAKSEPTRSILKYDQVEVGKVYQLVATPFENDLVRYVMPDLMECIALGDNILGSPMPVFKYYARADNLLVLHNFTRINEDELLEVLRRADIPFVDFTAVRELHGSREYMNLYIELREEMDLEEVLERVNQELIEYDKDWRDLNQMVGYKPIKVTLLERGSFKRYLQKRGGLPKVNRINMRKEHLELLTSKDGED